MSYYGSDPFVSTEPTIDDSGRALEAAEAPEGAEGTEEQLGDGLLRRVNW